MKYVNDWTRILIPQIELEGFRYCDDYHQRMKKKKWRNYEIYRRFVKGRLYKGRFFLKRYILR